MRVPHDGRTILVVDDDAATREAERAVLAENGFRVREASDGAEAMWQVLHDGPPAVVVLDVQMPGVDGPSFARELRAGGRHIPLVVLTGGDARRAADRCNAEAYLAKPFDAAALVRLVRRLAL